MKTYEYKTKIVKVVFGGGEWFVPKDLAVLDKELSTEGADGWRYVDVIRRTETTATPGTMLVLLFERETTPVRRQRTKGVDPRA